MTLIGMAALGLLFVVIFGIAAARTLLKAAAVIVVGGGVALFVLTMIKEGSGLVFLGQRKGTRMSDMTLMAVLRRMGRGDLTAHGFRSTFRDWAAEATGHPNHVVEQALAHAIPFGGRSGLSARRSARKAQGAHGRLGELPCEARSTSVAPALRRATRGA